MPNRPVLQSVAIAGAVAISASLIGFAALPHSSSPPTQTRAVTLTAGDTELFVPDTSTFDPTVAEGYPPLVDVLQGTETWNLTDGPTGYAIALGGTDVQTTFGSFTNNDFQELTDTQTYPLGAETIPQPASGTEIDLANFGGGFENEWINGTDGLGSGPIYSDTIITPFGNYTIPLSSPDAIAAQAGADAAASAAQAGDFTFTDLLNSIEGSISTGQGYFTAAETAFAGGDTAHGVSDALAGLNNVTVGVQSDLLVNGYAFLTGEGGYAGLNIQPVGAPVDFADGLAEAQSYEGFAQTDFTSALTDFAAGNTASGLSDLSSLGIDSSNATDAFILALLDSLPGFAPGL